MKRLTLLSLLIGWHSLSFGQITGAVIDQNGVPVSFANVILLEAIDSSFVTGTSTEDDGSFSIEPSELGNFLVKISSISYQTYESSILSITTSNKSIDLGKITLLSEPNGLVEVIVSAKKDFIQNTPTGQIINIQGSLMTKGSNTLQILERLPGIVLDRRNNQFSMNGQSGIALFFDGRRVQMSMEELMVLLESTVADNIEKIELITSPTAQYDADGGAGIINIIFKKKSDLGTKINYSATAGYGFREKAVTSLGISHGFEKATLHASYSFLHDVGRSGFKGNGTSHNPIIGGRSIGQFENFGERTQNTHNINLAGEYLFSSKFTVGSDLSISLANTHNLAHIANIWDVQDVEYIRMKSLSDGRNKRQNLIASLYSKYKFSEKSKLDVDLSYIGFQNDSPNTIRASYFDEQGNDYTPNNENFTDGIRAKSISKIKVGVLKMDYSQEINKDLNAAFGIKGSYSKNTNNSSVEQNINGAWEIDPRSQSQIDGDEKVLAAYSQFRFDINEKNKLQAGLRYEYWQREISTYDGAFKIAKLFPSLLYTYAIDERTNMNLNYSRRISRPAYVDLISNLFYNDPTAIFTGNPLLKPSITDAIKLDFTRKGINIGLSLQQEKDPIIRYQLTSNEAMDILIVSPQNVDYQKSINLFLNCPIQITDGWRWGIGSTTSLRRYKVSYNVMPAEKTYIFQNINFNQSIKLPKNFELELSGWYNFPFYEGTNKLKGFGVANLAFAKKLNNEKGTLQLAFPDIFRSLSVHTHISGMAPIVFDIDTYSNWRDETSLYRVVKLTYSRSFGKQSRSVDYHFEGEERERIR